jgi:hypothetical protein
MLERVLEPEVMDDYEEARAYNAMDHSLVNRRFAEDLLSIEPLQERRGFLWNCVR